MSDTEGIIFCVVYAVLLAAVIAAVLGAASWWRRDNAKLREYKRQLDERNDAIDAHYQRNLDKFNEGRAGV